MVRPGEKRGQYAAKAASWTEGEYGDPGAYLRHRAELVVGLGCPLEPGESVLDLACGDGGLGLALQRHGLRYRGVDDTPEMVAAGRRLLGESAEMEVGDLNTYVPAEPVDATTVFRAIYYVVDRRRFFERVAETTRKKLVFDLNPRQFSVEEVRAELRAAGFDRVELRPFFVPQTMRLVRPLLATAIALERSGPLARLLLHRKFTYVVAAERRRQRPGGA